MLVVLGALLTGKLSGASWILVAPPLLFGYVWFAYYKRALNVPDQMPDRNVKVRFDLESITFESIDHTSTMKWSRIKKLWVSPEVLLLFTYDNQTFSLLPVAPLGEDGKRFIETKVREHGGKVS